jgi:hypothetical protein
MADRGAIIITWGKIRSGIAPATSMGVLAKSLAYYDQAVKDGRASGYRVYASTQRMGGQLVIEGELASLSALEIDSESLKLLAQAGQVVDDLRVELMAGGSADDATTYYLTGLAAMQEAGLA